MSDSGKPYNPLDTPNIAESLARETLTRTPTPIADLQPFAGAGIYALYYIGNFPPYQRLARANRTDDFSQPIYVGKAVHAGARKGIISTTLRTPLHKRLREHRESLQSARNLDIADFHFRHLVTEDLFIPLGESLLINRFQPLWNTLIDGFGNHNPGKGRYKGQQPRWDVLHPGRGWAANLQPRTENSAAIERDVIQYLAQRIDP